MLLVSFFLFVHFWCQKKIFAFTLSHLSRLDWSGPRGLVGAEGAKKVAIRGIEPRTLSLEARRQNSELPSRSVIRRKMLRPNQNVIQRRKGI